MGKSKGRKECTCFLGQDEVLGDKTERAWAVCFGAFLWLYPLLTSDCEMLQVCTGCEVEGRAR